MLIEWIAYGSAAVLSVPAAVVCAECVAALLPARNGKSSPSSAQRPRMAVLVPAHNEEDGLGRTLEQLKAQAVPGDRIVVIADNCTDQTAAVAVRNGVECVQRVDEDHRGKGYALDAGMKYLGEPISKSKMGNPKLEGDVGAPDVVIIVDADCIVEDGALTALVEQVQHTARPAQAVYLMEAPPEELGPSGAVSILAFLVKNWVRPLGLKRLGMPCVLTGTGMAFAWRDLAQAQLASGNIVEDMQLGLDLAERGKGPLLCEEARVMGQLPAAGRARATQRKRWEHGHLRTIVTQVPRLWWGAIRKCDVRLAVLGLDVAVPPLSLLVMAMVAGLLFALAVGVARGAWIPFIVLADALGLLGVCVALAWGNFGRGRVPGKALVAAPVYAVSKVMVYVSFVFKREKKWVRTERAGEVGRAEIAGVKK